jgi:hypothetical protein
MRFVIILFVSGFGLTMAKAEYVMLTKDGAPATAEHASLAEPALPITKPHRRTRRSPAPAPVLAGFGDQVSLSFAVRQIVPARYHVVFAGTVDPTVAIDWKGGKPWRATLADALKPLGLAVSVAGPTVAIGAPLTPPAD